MEVEEHRSWSKSTSSSDSEKEEPLLGRSSRKIDAENVNPMLPFSGHVKVQLQPEKADEIVLITTATDKSVVFDKEQGIWKCRICSWTYKRGTPWIDHIQKTTRNHWDQCFFCESRGGGGFKHLFSDSGGPYDVQGHIFEKNYGDEVFSPITKELDAQRSPFDEINDQHEEGHKDSSTSELLPQPSEESFKGFIVEKSSPEIIAANDEVNLLKETDFEETEYDVETVLEKQNTHDLYCPNCRSCITRVILCKRKRTAKIPKDAKRPKLT